MAEDPKVFIDPIPSSVVVFEPDWFLRGHFERGTVGEEVVVTNWQQFEETFGAHGEAARNAYEFFKGAVGSRLRVTRIGAEEKP